MHVRKIAAFHQNSQISAIVRNNCAKFSRCHWKNTHLCLTQNGEGRSASSHLWGGHMQREWKTWSQIATLIMKRIWQQPGGHSLLWLEFAEFDDETSHGTFIIETDGISDKEHEILAACIMSMLLKLRMKYKISSATIH